MAGTLTVQNLQGPSSGANANKVIIPSGHTLDASGGTLTPSSGQVVQVRYGELSSRVTYNNQSFGSIGLSATITPTSATSLILITICFGRLSTSQTNGDHGGAIRVMRNGVDSGLNGPSDGSRPRAAFKFEGRQYNGDHAAGGYGMTGIDAPSSTSALTYDVQAWNQASAYPLIINGSHTNGNNYQDYHSRTKSFIILQEIAQ